MDPMGLIEAMKDPQMRHAALVHMPVALAGLGAMLAFVSALFMGRNHTLRWVTCGAFVLLIGFAKLAENSGEDAEHAMDGTLAAMDVVSRQLHEHESMAQKVWLMGIACAVLVGLSAIPKKRWQAGISWVALLMSGFTGLWVAQTAHHGGVLVYEHGAGAPVVETVAATPDANDGAVEDGDGSSNGEAEIIEDPRLTHFREHVKPVLIDSCLKCHNHNRHKADLNLMTMATIFEGGLSGPAVVPGDPDASWLIMAVRHEEDLEMPAKADKLSDEVIAQLEKWVRDGAVWESLGDFSPPPPDANTAPAPVENTTPPAEGGTPPDPGGGS